jgi:SAM-dependent methyltransferase
MGLDITWVVADARFLPFADQSFSAAFSYSVIQHFSREDARRSLNEIGRVLSGGGRSKIQMPNAFGLRSFYHLWRRGFSEGTGFDVRYYSPRELANLFSELIGPTVAEVDGFFGLGLQPSDRAIMPLKHRVVLRSSEALRRLSRYAPILKQGADSLWLTSIKPARQ